MSNKEKKCDFKREQKKKVMKPRQHVAVDCSTLTAATGKARINVTTKTGTVQSDQRAHPWLDSATENRK